MATHPTPCNWWNSNLRVDADELIGAPLSTGRRGRVVHCSGSDEDVFLCALCFTGCRPQDVIRQ